MLLDQGVRESTHVRYFVHFIHQPGQFLGFLALDVGEDVFDNFFSVHECSYLEGSHPVQSFKVDWEIRVDEKFDNIYVVLGDSEVKGVH